MRIWVWGYENRAPFKGSLRASTRDLRDLGYWGLGFKGPSKFHMRPYSESTTRIHIQSRTGLLCLVNFRILACRPRFLGSTLLPFLFEGFPLLALNIRKKGTLIIKGLPTQRVHIHCHYGIRYRKTIPIMVLGGLIP